MPWAISQDTTTDRTTNKREVTKHIEELVACGLIGEDNGSIIDIAKGEIRTTADLHEIADLVKVLLSHRLIIDDKCIVQVTTLNQIICEKHLYLTDEDERTARSNLLIEVSEIFKRSKLIAQHGRVKGDMYVDTELAIGKQDNT